MSMVDALSSPSMLPDPQTRHAQIGVSTSARVPLMPSSIEDTTAPITQNPAELLKGHVWSGAPTDSNSSDAANHQQPGTTQQTAISSGTSAPSLSMSVPQTGPAATQQPYMTESQLDSLQTQIEHALLSKMSCDIDLDGAMLHHTMHAAHVQALLALMGTSGAQLTLRHGAVDWGATQVRIRGKKVVVEDVGMTWAGGDLECCGIMVADKDSELFMTRTTCTGQDIDTDVASSTASKTSRSSSASSNVRSTAGKNVAGDIPPGAGSIQGAVLNLVNGGTAKLEGCLLQAPLALHSVIRAGEGSSLVCTSCTLQGGAHGVSNTGSCNVTLVDTLVSDCARGVHMFGDKSTLELTSCTISPSSTVGVYRARGGKRLLKYGGLVIMSGRAKVHSCKIMVDRGGILAMTGAVVTISATDIAVPSHPPVTEKTLSKVNAEMARPDEGFLISAIDSTVVMDQVKCTLDCDCPFVVSSIFATGPATRVRVSRTILQGQHSTIHTAASASVNLFQSQVSSVTGCIDAIGSSQIVANQCAFTSEGDTPSGIACLLIRAVGSARVRMEGCTAHFMSAMPSLIKSEGMLELLDCTWTMDTRHQRQGSADWKGVVIADKGGCCIANNCTFKDLGFSAAENGRVQLGHCKLSAQYVTVLSASQPGAYARAEHCTLMYSGKEAMTDVSRAMCRGGGRLHLVHCTLLASETQTIEAPLAQHAGTSARTSAGTSAGTSALGGPDMWQAVWAADGSSAVKLVGCRIGEGGYIVVTRNTRLQLQHTPIDTGTIVARISGKGTVKLHVRGSTSTGSATFTFYKGKVDEEAVQGPGGRWFNLSRIAKRRDDEEGEEGLEKQEGNETARMAGGLGEDSCEKNEGALAILPPCQLSVLLLSVQDEQLHCPPLMAHVTLPPAVTQALIPPDSSADSSTSANMHVLTADVTPPFCAECGATGGAGGARLQVCSGCKCVHYCSTGCRDAHWPLHKVACKHLRRAQKPLQKGKDPGQGQGGNTSV